MLNKIIIEGRLTSDPELRLTQNGVATVSFTVACDRPVYKKGQEKKTDFLPVKAWRNTAEFASRYFKKGDAVLIIGRMHAEPYDDKDGNKRTFYHILAEEVNFPLTQKPKETANTSTPTGYESNDNNNFTYDSGYEFEEILSDGDTPF